MNAPSVELKVDWATHEASSFACKRWHYSESMPVPPLVKIGVWENGQFIGVVLFSRGACAALGAPYGCKAEETCELTSVALSKHKTSVSKIISISMKFLRKHCPGLRIIVSFADQNEGHHGGIYQAGNWIYLGLTAPSAKYIDKTGREWHPRQVSTTGFRKQFGSNRPVIRIQDCSKVECLGKHRYVMPLDDSLRKGLLQIAQPYPKRAAEASIDAPVFQTGEDGATPIQPLQSKNSSSE